MPLVSVCIATYNRRHYLGETLASVFRQTFRDYEVIVLDDGSTDGTEEWLKRRDLPIRYYQQDNIGHPRTSNRLIELASGKYISFLDSDDLLIDDALERLVQAIGNAEDRIAYGPYLRIDSQGKQIGRDKRRLYSGKITRRLFSDVFVHPNGSLFPKLILIESGGFDPSIRVSYDYDLFLRLSLRYEFIAVAEPTFMRRRHTTNVSGYNAQNNLTVLGLLEDFYFHKGGKNVVPARDAYLRLARQAYRAGKCFAQERNYSDAMRMINTSLHYHVSFRAVWLLESTNFRMLCSRWRNILTRLFKGAR